MPYKGNNKASYMPTISNITPDPHKSPQIISSSYNSRNIIAHLSITMRKYSLVCKSEKPMRCQQP
jgi:hypothetical protein